MRFTWDIINRLNYALSPLTISNNRSRSRFQNNRPISDDRTWPYCEVQLKKAPRRSYFLFRAYWAAAAKQQFQVQQMEGRLCWMNVMAPKFNLAGFLFRITSTNEDYTRLANGISIAQSSNSRFTLFFILLPLAAVVKILWLPPFQRYNVFSRYLYFLMNLITVTLFLILSRYVHSQQPCYLPNGETASSNYRVCGSNITDFNTCCPAAYSCLEDGLCKSGTSRTKPFASSSRGACTDQDWSGCPSICLSGNYRVRKVY